MKGCETIVDSLYLYTARISIFSICRYEHFSRNKLFFSSNKKVLCIHTFNKSRQESDRYSCSDKRKVKTEADKKGKENEMREKKLKQPENCFQFPYNYVKSD